MQFSVLIIDDDPQVRHALERFFQKESFESMSAETGEAGVKMAKSRLPSLIVLDIQLPGMSGIEACQALKRDHVAASIPILMITGNDKEGQDIITLELGADDYLCKPFDLRRLFAHARALLRRGPYLGTRPGVLEKPGIRLDIDNKVVFLEQRKHSDLTPKEFDLLYYVLQNDTKIVSRNTLYRKVWGTKAVSSGVLRTVDVHIQRIRKKLSLARTFGIVSVSGRGYHWKSASLS